VPPGLFAGSRPSGSSLRPEKEHHDFPWLCSTFAPLPVTSPASAAFAQMVMITLHPTTGIRFRIRLLGAMSARTIDPTERRSRPMCANCGCGKPEDQMGDERNILWSEIVGSAEANDITPAEAVRNIQAMAEQMGAN
jgi:hypothetical protein